MEDKEKKMKLVVSRGARAPDRPHIAFYPEKYPSVTTTTLLFLFDLQPYRIETCQIVSYYTGSVCYCMDMCEVLQFAISAQVTEYALAYMQCTISQVT